MKDDDEMPLNLIKAHVANLVKEYESLLWLKIEEMQKKDAVVTIRKARRLKKSVLFNMLRGVTKK